MDISLRHYLPIELVYLIMKDVHKMNFRPCLYAIENNLIWCRVETSKKKSKIKTYIYTFLIGDYYGYYQNLPIED